MTWSFVALTGEEQRWTQAGGRPGRGALLISAVVLAGCVGGSSAAQNHSAAAALSGSSPSPLTPASLTGLDLSAIGVSLRRWTGAMPRISDAIAYPSPQAPTISQAPDGGLEELVAFTDPVQHYTGNPVYAFAWKLHQQVAPPVGGYIPGRLSARERVAEATGGFVPGHCYWVVFIDANNGGQIVEGTVCPGELGS